MGELLHIRTKQDKDMISIGGHVPSMLNSHLIVYSLAKQISKSEVIRSSLKNYMKDKQTIEELLVEISEGIQKLWDFTEKLQFKTFIYLIKLDLKKIGLTKKQTAFIIKKIIK